LEDIVSIRSHLRRKGRIGVVLAAVLLLGTGTAAGPATATAVGPAAVGSAPASARSDTRATVAAAQALQADGLPGANDWSCKPGAAHPRPIVLVHGTFATGTLNWIELAPLLAAEGYCVFAPTYGREPGVPLLAAIAPVADSAAQLRIFVDGVLAATGTGRVDIVGHSLGGMMPRYYLKFLGGADKVGRLVALAPDSHGTTLDGLASLLQSAPGTDQALLGGWCPGCLDQLAGSPFLQRLNADGDTVPDVEYTVLSSRYDLVVTPVQSQFLQGPNVRNVLLQDLCPLDLALHTTIAFDPVALHEVLNALDPAHATPTGCRLTP
jgi:triacylglycerol esterase/lipase EstA (alpha/beta hydrolase family)